MNLRIPMVASLILIVGSVTSLSAEDELWRPRIGPQVMMGTSGVEPGIFAEWRFPQQRFIVRPEVFLNEDERAGAGAMIAWDPQFNLPERHRLIFGPRIVYHNSDENGWEADAAAIWNFDLIPSQRGRHYLEVIGAVGVLEDEKDGDDDLEAGASIGIGYGFQF